MVLAAAAAVRSPLATLSGPAALAVPVTPAADKVVVAVPRMAVQVLSARMAPHGLAREAVLVADRRTADKAVGVGKVAYPEVEAAEVALAQRAAQVVTAVRVA